ncbi:choice-of-anchor I family protein [Arenicella xantha]|uniref:Choice-of-anchor I domain-containing protein n=1 Tax=Arenicella xantha TaxID=644221 RepID=A0A395JMD3_9GAMM|nr:choice-of-anchor I family protein [Arenicella xantha]RBP52801.1 hypothetical protein DFR28_101185 [Arenicella xantha]
MKHSLIAFFLLNSLAWSINSANAESSTIKLSPMSQIKLGSFDQGAAEIAAFDAISKRAFVVNGQTKSVDILSLADPTKPTLLTSISVKKFGSPNSVAVNNGLVAVAVASKPKQADGSVVLFDTQGQYLHTFSTGALPDMVTFTPDGKRLLVANEGEPNDDYSVDPEGSITIITLAERTQSFDMATVRTAGFTHFNKQKLDPRIRVFGKNASVAQDLEPEYITVSADSQTAWISLQENNALAVLDINQATITALLPLGTQSHSTLGNGIDASDEDGGINIQNWPVLGMYQPDTIASYEVDGHTYIVTANEGDARDYDGYSEETRVAKMTLSKILLDDDPKLAHKRRLGRLKVSTVNADTDGDNRVDTLYAFGTRSFSIWTADGEQVYDSGSEFADVSARLYPKLFNNGDDRSDNKGSEPEALTIGRVNNVSYAFIGLERSGGVMVYDISKPREARFVDYLNTRNADLPDEHPDAGDIAPESIVFVSAEDSPTGKPFLITANEVSGTVALYAIESVDRVAP